MIGFWILAAVMLLAAYALFVPAFRGSSGKGAIDRQKLNWLLHRQRRQDLELDAGSEDPEGFAAELDKDLLGDLSNTEAASSKGPEAGRWPLLGALLLTPILTVVLYTQLGRPDLADFSAQPQPPARSEQVPQEMQALIERLAERLKNAPEDPQGWLLLGRSYSETEQFDKAVEAYEQAVRRAPEDLNAKGMYAEALAQAAGGSYQGRPAELALAILEKDPKQRNALWVAAAASAERGDKPGAASFLQRLKVQFPADSEDAKFLGGLIAKVQGEEPAPGTAAENPSPQGGGLTIHVRVSLSESLKAKAAADDTVFIFARAAKGPPMPLAIVRKKVVDLPAEVALDDSMGMVQGMNLSAFPTLVIGARVSKSGNALPAPGDLQGLSEPTEAINGKTYAVDIADEVR